MANRDSKREAKNRATSQQDKRMSPMLIRALDQPTRREALRLLHRSDEGMSAVQMSAGIDDVSTNISYHLKVLTDLGAIAQVSERQVRGVPEKFFESKVSGHDQVGAILADTEDDDKWLRK